MKIEYNPFLRQDVLTLDSSKISVRTSPFDRTIELSFVDPDYVKVVVELLKEYVNVL